MAWIAVIEAYRNGKISRDLFFCLNRMIYFQTAYFGRTSSPGKLLTADYQDELEITYRDWLLIGLSRRDALLGSLPSRAHS